MVRNNTTNELMKPASITFRTTEKIKEALEEQARQGHRSLSSHVEMILIRHLEKRGVDCQEDNSD